MSLRLFMLSCALLTLIITQNEASKESESKLDNLEEEKYDSLRDTFKDNYDDSFEFDVVGSMKTVKYKFILLATMLLDEIFKSESTNTSHEIPPEPHCPCERLKEFTFLKHPMFGNNPMNLRRRVRVWKKCSKKSIITCQKLCIKTYRAACKNKKCQRSLKHKFRRECKMNCKRKFRLSG